MKIRTNRPEYLNDFAEVLRLYLALDEAALIETFPPEEPGVPALNLQVSQEPGAVSAEVQILLFQDGRQRRSEYRYVHPFAGGDALEQKRREKRAAKIALFRAMGRLLEAYTPWGSLTGIRPTRLYRELLQTEGEQQAERMMLHEFDVQPEKLRLVQQIHRVQQPILDSQREEDVGVYIGIPFCRSRCLYCSFAAEVRTKKSDVAGYLAALKADISHGAAIVRENGWKVRSLYMGGGTPTALTAGELEDVLSHALKEYGGFGREFTVEAGRPDTIDREKLRLLKGLGVGRISINPQSMNGHTLELIGRSHSPEQIEAAFAMAREEGFSNINMDLIAGLPGEDQGDMERTLAAMERLDPENLTVHTLALKRSSKLKQRLDEFPLPGAQTADAMVSMARETAGRMGLQPYYMYRQKYMRGNLENVGYAKPGYECVYNVDMMEDTTSIMAHGAGAMTKRIFDRQRRVERIPNPKELSVYCAKVEALAREKRQLFAREH